MKLTTLFRLIIVSTALIAGTVSAQEWRDALPGEALYEAKQRIETAELNAAADPLEKASVNLKHADRRVDEIREAASRGKTGSIESLSGDYAEAIRRADEQIARARDQGRDTGRALQEVDRATQKHTEVLTGLLDRVPEQAVPAIQHAREVSRHGRQTALQRLHGSEQETAGKSGMQDGRSGTATDQREPARRGLDVDTNAPGFERGTPGGIGNSRGGFGNGRPGGGPAAGGRPGR